MREILFRGKRADNGEWVEGFYFIDERDIEDGVIWRDVPQIQQRYGDHYDYFDVDPLTIGQFTGLTDKNGKKIFEGDRVQYYSSIHGEFRGDLCEVKYGEFNCSCCEGVYGWCFENGDIRDSQTYEVIGTIHDKAVNI